jgi:hypothetical protein
MRRQLMAVQDSSRQVACNGQRDSNYSVVPFKCAGQSPVTCSGGKCRTSISACRVDWNALNVQVRVLANQGTAPTDVPGRILKSANSPPRK